MSRITNIFIDISLLEQNEEERKKNKKEEYEDCVTVYQFVSRIPYMFIPKVKLILSKNSFIDLQLQDT